MYKQTAHYYNNVETLINKIIINSEILPKKCKQTAHYYNNNDNNKISAHTTTHTDHLNPKETKRKIQQTLNFSIDNLLFCNFQSYY